MYSCDMFGCVSNEVRNCSCMRWKLAPVMMATGTCSSSRLSRSSIYGTGGWKLSASVSSRSKNTARGHCIAEEYHTDLRCYHCVHESTLRPPVPPQKATLS